MRENGIISIYGGGEMARTIEELDNFNKQIVESGLNPRIKEFLVAINNCDKEFFEWLVLQISKFNFDERYGNRDYRIQVNRALKNGEFQILDIKLDENENIIFKLVETQKGIVSNKTPGITIVVDKDGNGKESSAKSLRQITFKLENERLTNIREYVDFERFSVDEETKEVMKALYYSKFGDLNTVIKDLVKYDRSQIWKQQDSELKFFTRDIAPYIVESTKIQPEVGGIYIEKYVSDRSGEREIERYTRIYTQNNGKMEVRFESTDKGVQDYNFQIVDGKLVGENILEDGRNGK